MNIKELAIGMVALTGIAGSAKDLSAQITGNVEALKVIEQDGTDLVRPNLFFEVPEIRASNYTWHEFYDDGTSSGRTALSKPIKGALSIRTDITYGTGSDADASIGLQVEGNILPEVFGQAYTLNFNGEKTIMGYFIDTKIGPIKLSSFNEWNISNGIEQDYEEVSVKVPINRNCDVGLNLMLLQGENGGTSLDSTLRVIVSRGF